MVGLCVFLGSGYGIKKARQKPFRKRKKNKGEFETYRGSHALE